MFLIFLFTDLKCVCVCGGGGGRECVSVTVKRPALPPRTVDGRSRNPPPPPSPSSDKKQQHQTVPNARGTTRRFKTQTIPRRRCVAAHVPDKGVFIFVCFLIWNFTESSVSQLHYI